MRIRYKRAPHWSNVDWSRWLEAVCSYVSLPEAEECFGGYWRVYDEED